MSATSASNIGVSTQPGQTALTRIAVGGELVGGGSHEADRAVLGGVVGAIAGAGAEPAGRGDDDDRAAAPARRSWPIAARIARKTPFRLTRDHPVPLGGIEIGDRRRVAFTPAREHGHRRRARGASSSSAAAASTAAGSVTSATTAWALPPGPSISAASSTHRRRSVDAADRVALRGEAPREAGAHAARGAGDQHRPLGRPPQISFRSRGSTIAWTMSTIALAITNTAPITSVAPMIAGTSVEAIERSM